MGCLVARSVGNWAWKMGPTGACVIPGSRGVSLEPRGHFTGSRTWVHLGRPGPGSVGAGLDPGSMVAGLAQGSTGVGLVTGSTRVGLEPGSMAAPW